MGTEYSLVKVATSETYYLGKPAMREPEGDWQKRAKGLHPVKDAMEWLAVMQPSPSAMWRIGTDDGKFTVVVLADRWTAADLAEVINTACFDEDDREQAMRIARDLLDWAGRDEVLLIPDDAAEQIEERFGIDPSKLRQVRSIGDVPRADAPSTDRTTT